MVGFFREPSKKKEESGANQQKLKSSNSPENLRFDFEDFSSEFGGFSVASIDSFTDFDSIKDWIEEMQSPGKAETGNGVDNLTGNSSVVIVQGTNSEQKIVSSKGCSSSDECMDSKDGLGGDSCEAKLDEPKECGNDGFVEITKLGSCQVAEINADNLQGDMKGSHGNESESNIGVLGDEKCCKIESLNCSIEEGLEKVTLVGNEDGLVQFDNGMKKVSTPVVDEDNDSDSDNENETSSASSSTSSSSSESDDDDEEEEEEDVNEKEKLQSCKGMDTGPSADMEEGQIIDSDAENMVSWSDENDKDDSVQNSEEFQFADEDDDTVKGPIKSKNELEVLPPVPPVTVTLQPCHQILPVGVISSVLGVQVIVEGSEMHNPLSEGSILWITESRLPLGLVDEIFGPVKTPYYIVRYNSESEVPSGIQNGTLVGFVAEFVGHVLNDKNLYQKGYDASGENDEEVLDEDDFSDDEKEAEYKRMLKMSKRGNNNQGKKPKNKKKNNRGENKTWTKDQHSTFQSPRDQSSQPDQMQRGTWSPVLSASEGNRFGQQPTGPIYSGGPAVPTLSQGYQLGPPLGQIFPGGPATIPQQVQQAGLLLNGLLGNGIGFQQQNMAMSSGIPMNSMPWLQQNHAQNLQVPTPWLQQQHVSYSQMPVMNPPLCQQPFDLSQLVGATATPFGPANFSARPTNGPWVGMLGQNFPIQAPLSLGVPGQSSQLPMSPATLSNAQQGLSCNSQLQNSLHRNEEVSSQFNQGSSSGRGGRGRGRGRKPFHRRGGQFCGGRGRQQP